MAPSLLTHNLTADICDLMLFLWETEQINNFYKYKIITNVHYIFEYVVLIAEFLVPMLVAVLNMMRQTLFLKAKIF